METANSVNLEALMALNRDVDLDEEMQRTTLETSAEKDVGAVEEQKKIMVRKGPRKLPAFMARPIPESEQDIVRENFRVFVKWALTLIHNNPRLTAFGMPKFVGVNLPKNYEFVFDALKAEEAETGLPFVRFAFADKSEELSQNLELFGGLHATSWHSSAKF